MSTIQSSVTPPEMASPGGFPGLYRLTVEQYEAMAGAGILTDSDHVELVHGLLVTKMTKKPAHSVAARAVADALGRLLPPGFFVTREDPIRIPGHSEPEPDAAIVRGKSRDYKDRHPEPSQVALVVEVADVSLDFDRTEKLAMYAGGGIQVYWIVNLIDQCVVVHSEPEGNRYRNVQVLESDDSITVVVGGRELGKIAVSELLP